MILVDTRAGSRELSPVLRRRFRLPVEDQDMEFGDVAFAGQSSKGWIDVGIEVKKLSDLLSSLDDHRLIGHQIRGMHNTYEEVWLAIIGDWASDKEGRITVPRSTRTGKRRWVVEPHNAMYCDLESRLLTLQLKGGVRIVRHQSQYQVCRWIGLLYHWWQKRWGDHHTLDVFFTPRPDDRRIFRRPLSTVRRWAKELPGIEWTISQDVERRFRTAQQMANAELAEWMSIPGIGKAKAQAAWRAIRESNPNVEVSDGGGGSVRKQPAKGRGRGHTPRNNTGRNVGTKPAARKRTAKKR